jgi:hypothetical protein
MGTHLVSFIDELVSTGDGLQSVDVIELGSDLITEEPASSTRAHSPRIDILRVTPDQVTEGTFMRDLLSPRNDSDLVDGPDLGAQPSMDAEHRTVDNGCKHQEIKYLTASFPDRGISVFLLTLFIESVDLGDLS